MKNYVAILLLVWSSFVLAQDKRPNILFIMSDDHAYQAISAYNDKLIQTPNIDKIAQEGILFSNASVTNSICAPSRATILTGKFSHINGKVAKKAAIINIAVAIHAKNWCGFSFCFIFNRINLCYQKVHQF